jgi:hypothetical protein
MKKNQQNRLFANRLFFILLCCCASLAMVVFSTTIAHAQQTSTSGMETIKLEDVNPLNLGGSQNAISGQSASAVKADLSTPGALISRVLTFAFPIAGIILFVMILWGGFEMISGATESKSMEAGKQRITAAVVGFLLLFAAYWMTQLVQIVFNVSILGTNTSSSATPPAADQGTQTPKQTAPPF